LIFLEFKAVHFHCVNNFFLDSRCFSRRFADSLLYLSAKAWTAS